MQTLSMPHVVNNNSGDSLSLWMVEEIASPPPLKEDLTADVCIVGGGIAGLTCAYFLTKNNYSVIVLESGSLAGGQSARTTAHLTWVLDDRYDELKRLFGIDGARMAAESHLAALNAIEKIVQDEKISCDFEKIDAYLFLAPHDSLELLNKEQEVIQKIGFPVERLRRAPLNSFDTGPCLRFPNQGQFHILKYLHGLCKAIQRQKGKIFTYTHVEDIQDGDPCLVKTAHHQVKAKAVIVATNTPINDRFMIHSKQAAYRTYVIAGHIPRGSVTRGLYYDTLDPYHYIRLQKDERDSQNEWLLIGGEDHKTGQDEDVFEKYLHLEQWARSHFPMLSTIDYQWSGQVMEPIDALAFIGRNPHDKNIFIATGDSGNGMTHGTIAGLLLTDLIRKGSHPWAKLYNPARKTLQAAGEFAKENLNVAAQYSEWMMPGEVDTLKQIRQGTGAIIRKGLKKYAVYRDNQGHYHCLSAVCPHLGCLVRWNPGEKSWDCPCHGSRFDCQGKVMNGPAIHDLTPEPEILK